MPNATTPDRGGIGAPLSAEEIRAREETERREARAAEEAARKPAPPPRPYRVDTSGLATSNLPKPPVRRLGDVDQSSASLRGPATKPKPSLPPRLPPRQGSTPIVNSRSPAPPYSVTADAGSTHDAHISQGAVGRLGSAGVSDPGFGIGDSRPKREIAATTASQTDNQIPSTDNTQLSESLSRFARISTQDQNPGSPSPGTSLAEKQAAVKTAQCFRNDPSSVSLSDARDSAATANNFRERHGAQVSAGWKSANAFNKKHDIGNQVNSLASQGTAPSMTGVQESPPSPVSSPAASLPLHKRAPPPPPQKPSFSGGSATSPPPVPLSSKPRT